MMQKVQKMLSGNPVSERRALLKRYLLACVRDNVLSIADITSAPSKVMSMINADIIALLTEFKSDLKAGARGILKAARGAFAEIAQDVAGRRK